MRNILPALLIISLLGCSIYKKENVQTNYDMTAKTELSQNDIKSFVYQWFAWFDHQVDRETFLKHLPQEKVDMSFPDFPIKSRADFSRWYDGVEKTIQWNSHDIFNLEVFRDEQSSWNVGFDVHWKAKTYAGDTLDMTVHQNWQVTINDSRNLIIRKHHAQVILQ